MKKKVIVSFLLIATLFLTSCSSPLQDATTTTPETTVEVTNDVNKEFRYENLPTEWDLTEIYKDKAAWREDYNKCLTMVDNLPDYKGKLDNAESVLGFIMGYDYMREQYVQLNNSSMVEKFDDCPIRESAEMYEKYFSSSLRDSAMHELGVGTTRKGSV